jgi:hypothetical protein
MLLKADPSIFNLLPPGTSEVGETVVAWVLTFCVLIDLQRNAEYFKNVLNRLKQN